MKLPSHYLIVTFDGYAGAQPGIFQRYAQFTKPPAPPPSPLTKVLNRVGLRLKPQRFNCPWNNMSEVKKFVVAFSGIDPTSQQYVTLFSLRIVLFFTSVWHLVLADRSTVYALLSTYYHLAFCPSILFKTLSANKSRLLSGNRHLVGYGKQQQSLFQRNMPSCMN